MAQEGILLTNLPVLKIVPRIYLRGVHKCIDIAGGGRFLLENTVNTFQEEPPWSTRPLPTMSTCCLTCLNAFGTKTQPVPTGDIPFSMSRRLCSCSSCSCTNGGSFASKPSAVGWC